MRIFILLIFTCSISWLAKAQIPVYKNSVRLALEAIHVDAPQITLQTPALRYSALYDRQLANRRWLLEGSLSYINYFRREQFTPYDYYYKGDRSQRVSVDLTLFFNLLKNNRHALRLGTGPSFWYQRDGITDNLTGFPTSNLQQLKGIFFTRYYLHEFNVGLNLRGEYEFSITSRVTTTIRLSAVSNVLPDRARGSLVGTLSTAGLSVGYKF